MKILLIGEYSRLHNSLKEGLIKFGHEVTIVGTGDGFKDYPVDIKINSKISKYSFLRFISKALIRTLRINIVKLENYYNFNSILPELKNYDVVQLINESVLKSYPSLEIRFLKKLTKQNHKLFVLSCGTDYLSVKYANDKKLKYSNLTPYHEKKLKKEYQFVMQRLSPSHYKLHAFIFNITNGVIASDIDYHLPLLNHPKYLKIIPNAINTDKINYSPLIIKDRIHIFHGINSSNTIKKGGDIFEEALKIIGNKYQDRVSIKTTYDIPYDDYIKIYNDTHILMDQVYSYDQGYNALEAMAKGKVVFTGAEQEWLDYYSLKEDTIAINALPNVNYLVEKLEWLILNPKKIFEISKNARAFIEKEHHYKIIAEQYLKTWKDA
ncbi:glycosyltransferase [Psychroserpens sp. NJDZ02]|uniref:glycosyltransferase family protein n=1 Tax=Psychroserpens sp. NJDZ02 TaxID=2570561 RepID=UPI0010A76257|nr:glycosyltransferase [Psychroserpens sp. NJDZ02]QCE41865.1 glycosyltransferase family 4 protein [Psychroserpens sp. NJDZ02]